jgi:hypothetical protein
MSTGYAVVVSVSHVEKAYYEGWEGESRTSARDAEDVHQLLLTRGYFTRGVMADDKATRGLVLKEFDRVVMAAQAGDQIVVYYSGHGSSIPNVNHDPPDDKLDQVWCLYDGLLIDDEIDGRLINVRSGVEVVVISDSCDGGGTPGIFLSEASLRARSATQSPCVFPYTAASAPSEAAQAKAAPRGVIDRVYKSQRTFYDSKQPSPPADLDTSAGSILLFGACEKKENAFEDAIRSRYTDRLMSYFEQGFNGTYEEMYTYILDNIAGQTPTRRPMGKGSVDMTKQIAFKI